MKLPNLDLAEYLLLLALIVALLLLLNAYCGAEIDNPL